jgi:hypothetical protein
MALGLAALVTVDLVKALRTGKARGRGGTITREGRSALFKRQVIGDVIVLLFCAGVVVWWLVSG